MRTSCMFLAGAILVISFMLLSSVPSANGKISSKSFNSTKNKEARLSKRSRKSGESEIRKLLEETARYAINFNPGPGTGPSEGNSTKPGPMASAVVEMMNQIRDPFKHAVTSAVVAGLYIAALISLIIFATTGTIAFICSFSDCRHFFLGMKSDGSSPRPYSGGGPFLFKRRESNPYHWAEELQPVVQSLHESYDKYGHKERHSE